MDMLRFRCRPDPVDEDLLDESFTPKALSFDSPDESLSELECSRVHVDRMEVDGENAKAPNVTPTPNKKRKIQTTLSPDFLTGLKLEPSRKRLATIDVNTTSSKKRLTTTKISNTSGSHSSPPFGSLPFVVRKRDHLGDGSKKLLLPTIKGRHADLKSITPETLTLVLAEEAPFDNVQVSIVDCRYPYEYKGGHIRTALNIYLPEALKAHFLQNSTEKRLECTRNIVIFHCEFSSERAPDLARMLRNEDRCLNEARYPALYYPELYLLEGGYKAFFENYPELCVPQGYTPMIADGHKEEMRLHKKNVRLQGGGRGGTVAKTALSRRL